MEILAFYDITGEPIKIQIRSASQNDRLDFSFLKDINAIAEKWLERVGKRTFVSCKFDASPSILMHRISLDFSFSFIAERGS